MQKKWKRLSFASISLVLVGSIVGISAVSCSNNTNFVQKENNNNNGGIKSNHMINLEQGQKINYVAFGDSITAGFDAKYDYGLGGYFNKQNNEIYGLGYPSFLMRYFQDYDKNCISSFNNFGISGSTITDWLYLLGLNEVDGQTISPEQPYSVNVNNQTITITRNPLQHDLNHFRTNAQLSPIPTVKDRLNDYFGNSQTSINRDYFIKSIKEANLITFTLGANDFFATGLFQDVLGALMKHEGDWNTLEQALKNAFSVITNYLTILLNQLRKLNPSAAINVISYPMPLIRVVKIIDVYFKIPNSTVSLSNYLLDSLNGAIKQGVIDFNNSNKEDDPVNFINVFNQPVWEMNANYYDEDLYSIHPTVIGYRQMAKTIFLKLTLNKDNESQLHNLINDWSNTFINSDYKDYKQEVYFNEQTTNQKIVNYVNQTSIINDPIKLQTEWAKYANENVEASIVYNHFANLNFFFKVATYLYNKLFMNDDYNHMIYNLLGLSEKETSTNWYKLISSVFGANEASVFFTNFLNYFTNYFRNVSQITSQQLFFSLKKMICDGQLPNSLLNLIFNNTFIEKNQATLLKVFLANILNLKNDNLLNLYQNDLSFLNPKVLTLIQKLFIPETQPSVTLNLTDTQINSLSLQQITNMWLEKKVKDNSSIFWDVILSVGAHIQTLFSTYINTGHDINKALDYNNPSFQQAFRIFNLINIVLKSYHLENDYGSLIYQALKFTLVTTNNSNDQNMTLFLNGLYGYNTDQVLTPSQILSDTSGMLKVITDSLNNTANTNNDVLIQILIKGYFLNQ